MRRRPGATGTHRLLAFDFGVRRIGVAAGQEATRGASPITTLGAVRHKPDWVAIAGLLEEWAPDRLVVGHPRHLDGTESEITRAAQRFARQLEGRFGLPVDLVDERLSSWEAGSRLTGCRGQRPRKGDLDKHAACIILETWYQQQSALS